MTIMERNSIDYGVERNEYSKKMAFGLLAYVLPSYNDPGHRFALHTLLQQMMSDPTIGQSVVDYLQRVYPTLKDV